ncbi:MAG: 4Fe-4S binding protein [Methanomassiliicoccales archaeon]|nr:4Fe-4S binding protein [Methanomassiliicoccales archaeon]
MIKKKLILEFSPDLVDRPIIHRLSTEHGLALNILRATITEDGGRMILSLEGSSDSISAGIAYLNEKGVSVQDLDAFITKDDGRCTDCGACLSICPVKAYELDRTDWSVHFRSDPCIACGVCLDVCPVKAIRKVV